MLRSPSPPPSCHRGAQPPGTPVFFLMPPPPPRSTLFPYTTLFRSQVPPRGPARGAARCSANRGGVRHRRERHRQRDRKSTRLNSSHVSISYAVFCLKKKRDIRLCGYVVRSLGVLKWKLGSALRQSV